MALDIEPWKFYYQYHIMTSESLFRIDIDNSDSGDKVAQFFIRVISELEADKCVNR